MIAWLIGGCIVSLVASLLIVGWVLVMLVIAAGAIGDRLPECDCHRERGDA